MVKLVLELRKHIFRKGGHLKVREHVVVEAIYYAIREVFNAIKSFMEFVGFLN